MREGTNLMLRRGPFLILADESTPFLALQILKAGRCLRRPGSGRAHSPPRRPIQLVVGATVLPM